MHEFILIVLFILLFLCLALVCFYFENQELFEGPKKIKKKVYRKMTIEERLLQHLLPEATTDYLNCCRNLYKQDNLAEITTLTEARFIEEITNKYLEDIRFQELAVREMIPIFNAYYSELKEKFKR